MDYLKFNCYDLAAENVKVHDVYTKICQLSNELSGIIDSLDPQIKTYEGIQTQFAAAGSAVDDISLRILKTHNALDQIADVYYAAENKALQASESLPVSISINGRTSTMSSDAFPIAGTASISSSDLVLEDWLAELVYKYGNKGI